MVVLAAQVSITDELSPLDFDSIMSFIRIVLLLQFSDTSWRDHCLIEASSHNFIPDDPIPGHPHGFARRSNPSPFRHSRGRIKISSDDKYTKWGRELRDFFLLPLDDQLDDVSETGAGTTRRRGCHTAGIGERAPTWRGEDRNTPEEEF
ncbi:hypothetical protein JTE90_010227 [Oedothorax gibbosus]|uniref:Uncharacterized protein n=1 Tax=Oedothorax gibbosus TaxID=931172 RepID=A0AAV6UII5_9ARAC|nr:hypothetical protein JTE90_010227 [Oedothorax gibbosus]